MAPPVFKNTVIADEGQQLVRVGTSAGHGRDVVRRLDLTLAVLGPLAHHATDLLHAGPIDVVIQRGRGGDGAFL